MKKLILITVLLLATSTARAMDLPRHSVELGTEVSGIKYVETGLMHETGMMFGITESYTYRNNIMFRVEAKESWGRVGYRGSLSDGTSYTIRNISDYMVEPRILGGIDVSFRRFVLTPYLGVGYRALWDRMGKDPLGYDRQSNYLYVPLGVDAQIGLSPSWSLGATAEVDKFIHGWQNSYLSQCDVGYSDSRNIQTQGYGLRGAVRLARKNVSVETFARYWRIEDSQTNTIVWHGKIVGYGYEPKNTSTEIGVKVAIKY